MHATELNEWTGDRAGSQPLTWVGENLLSRRDVYKPLFRLFLLSLGLEVVGVPLLRQLPVRLDDLLLVGTPEEGKGWESWPV